MIWIVIGGSALFGVSIAMWALGMTMGKWRERQRILTITTHLLIEYQARPYPTDVWPTGAREDTIKEIEQLITSGGFPAMVHPIEPWDDPPPPRAKRQKLETLPGVPTEMAIHWKCPSCDADNWILTTEDENPDHVEDFARLHPVEHAEGVKLRLWPPRIRCWNCSIEARPIIGPECQTVGGPDDDEDEGPA